jgi:hypothetical protein
MPSSLGWRGRNLVAAAASAAAAFLRSA